MAIQEINVNYIPDFQQKQINCSQGDIGREFKVEVENGENYTIPEGAVVEIAGKKSDGKIFSYAVDGVDGNVVTILTKEQMTTTPGPVACEIRISKDGKIIGTANFTLYVEGGILDGYVSESEIDFIDRIRVELLAALARVEEAVDDARDYAEDAQEQATIAEQQANRAESAAQGIEQYVVDAQTAARNAQHSAEDAFTYSQDAEDSAEDASEAALQAGQSANVASQSANNASQSEQNAASSASNAQQSANSASQSASNASQSESNASQSEQNAANSASNAAQSASDAQGFAQYAQEYAEDALSNAEDAGQSATDAASSATAAAQSASNASQSESNASQSATQAGQSANSASQSATNASNSATEAETAADRAEATLVVTEYVKTIAVTDWDATTHIATITVSGVTTTSAQEILPLLATSAANISNNDALAEAVIYDAGQATDTIYLYAATIPSVDVSVRVIVHGGGN